MKNTITFKSNKQAYVLLKAIYTFMEKTNYYSDHAPEWLKAIEEDEIETIKPLLDQLRQINIPEE